MAPTSESIQKGLELHNSGNLQQAEAEYQKILRVDPRHADALHLLGVLGQQRGEPALAIEYIGKAIAVNGSNALYHTNLAAAHQALARYRDAENSCRRAIRLQPQYAEAHYKLGLALESLGKADAAIESYSRAVELKPAIVEAHLHMGNLLSGQNRVGEAEQCFRHVVEIAPRNASAWNNLGVACHSRDDTPAAISHFRRALEIEQDHIQANINLGSVLKNCGSLSEARACFQRVLARDPNHHKARILTAILLPPIFSSVEELNERRQEFATNVSQLIADGVCLDPEKDDIPCVFFLPYQGENDRDVQGALARLYPAPIRPPAHRVSYSHSSGMPAVVTAEKGAPAEKIRLGIISHHFRSHTIGHLSRGMIAELSREKFSVTVFSIGDHRDEIAAAIRASADEYVVLSTHVAQARRTIAEHRLDVLFYTDIGMDSYSYSLAFHRLATVQCATWGHPVTTGIPNVDYFISSDLIEPDDADGHYTENLVRLKGLPTYYYRPVMPESLPSNVSGQSHDRDYYDIPADCHLYLCPQSLFKFHPEFDALLKAILARDTRGRILLIEGVEPAWTETLRARFQRSFPEAADRVQFLPRQGRSDFLNLMSLCDAMLDPLHFGGGNTSYEAFALGIPVVTLPSRFMRGRVTAACYRKMGLSDCIAGGAAEYVDLAVRLASDAEYRKTLQTRILAANHVLYEDRDSLNEIEGFLQVAVARARSGRASGCVDSGSESREKLDAAPAPESEIVVKSALAELLRTSTCPACGHHVAVPFYDGGDQPLATVAWPRSAAEARSMRRLPLSFVRCVDCGHVYNCRFNYAEVPYSEKPNLMFNEGAVWTDHLRHVRDLIIKGLPEKPVVVEVGCGEGHLLRAVAEKVPTGRYIGFDPSNAINTGNGLIEGRRELFEPSRHLADLRPDLIISRHVLEHLMNPLGFVQAIAFAASWENIETRLLIEVPCIDGVIRRGRTVDFFYEHNSNFTTKSLERLLARCASEVEIVARSYNDEVVYGMARFRRRDDQVQFAAEAIEFHDRSARHHQTIRAAIDELAQSGRRAAIWGGTGKAAAFISQYGLDSKRFPLVVDSDLQKAGTYVPGAGQEILYRDFLIRSPVEVILIATQWRAGDIVAEIERCGIPYQTILLEHEGRLVDYFTGEHPYRKAHKAA